MPSLFGKCTRSSYGRVHTLTRETDAAVDLATGQLRWLEDLTIRRSIGLAIVGANSFDTELESATALVERLAMVDFEEGVRSNEDIARRNGEAAGSNADGARFVRHDSASADIGRGAKRDGEKSSMDGRSSSSGYSTKPPADMEDR